MRAPLLIDLTGTNGVISNATASGGPGARISGSYAAAGGNADASASATSTGAGAGGTATSSANSTGGAGSTRGAASAHATAITANGQLALASATATGTTGITQTTATTQGGGVVTTVSAIAKAQVGSTANAVSRADLGSVFGFNGSASDSYAFATEIPSASYVSSVLSSHSNLNAALGGPNASVFGAGSQGAFYSATASGAREYLSTIAWTIDATSLSGHLIAGLIDNQTLGAGFTSFAFTVTVGVTTVVNNTFTNVGTAQSFFNNNALDLRSFAHAAGLVVTLNFDLITSSIGSGFGAEFLLGATGNQPPVTTVPGLQSVKKGVPTAISGISVVDGDAASANETISVVLSDSSGLLRATGAGTITGSGTTTLSIVGTLSEVNSDLGTLTYQGNAVGSDTIDVATSDGRGGTDDDKIAVSVVSPLSGHVVLSTATEHVPLVSGTSVATFTDGNLSDVASGFTATIDWGDRTVTAGVVTGSSGSFTVSGGHTYADEGSDPLSVTLIRTSDALHATAAGTVTVGENDALTPHGTTLAATAGQALNNVVVASFTDTDKVTPADDFAATIDWGDGTTTAGSVTGSNGSFTVSGSHTYAAPGTDTVTVVLADDAPGTATATSTVTIAPATTTSLFDFVFTYADGKDYYRGTVADNGVYGYRVGQRITTSAGHYDIFNKGAATNQAAGTVVVTNYSHGGPGAASTVPVETAAGRPDGTDGLGSESDAVPSIRFSAAG